MERFEYGYFVRGERMVLGSVSRSAYDKKAKEIQDANYVSRSVLPMSFDSTIWFIDPLTQADTEPAE